MKVSRLIQVLQETASPDDELCVLWWEKRHFDYTDDDELILTDDNWRKVCDEFDQWDDAGLSTGEWIADAVSEYAELRPAEAD